MATADELLAGAMTEVEQVLIINWETRTIDIPKTITNIGVESDDDVKYLKFRAPRYYHGTDLSEFTVRINYLNANKEGDVYSPVDVTVADDAIEFTWVVGRFATMYQGDVKFNVCMILTGADDVIDQEVNTTPSVLPVLEGLETAEAVVEEDRDAMTAVVLEALERAQGTDLKGEPGYTPVKGVDYYTEAEREEFVERVVQDTQGVFANALKGNASGTVIRVDDVSPVEHTVKARVRGKNRACISKIVRTTSSDAEVNGSVLSIRRTNTNETWSNVYIEIGDYSEFIGKKLTVSLNGHNTYSWTLNLVGLDDSNKLIDGIVGVGVTNAKASLIATVPYMIGATKLALRFVSGNNHIATDDIYTFDNIQVEEGSVATTYEPYIDPTSVTVTACGKNLIDVKDVSLTDYTGYYHEISTGFEPVVGGQYVLSLDFVCDVYPTSVAVGCGVNNFESELTPFCAKDFDAGGHLEVPFVWNITEENIQKGETKLAIRVPRYNKSTTFSATVRNFQLEVGDTATEYEPYVGADYTPSADGTVDIVSVSPTMTLMTDTPGVTIEAEYSKDLNKSSAGSPVMIVEVTERWVGDEKQKFASHTPAQIYEHVMNGGTVILNGRGDIHCTLTQINSDGNYAAFLCHTDFYEDEIYNIYEDGSVEYTVVQPEDSSNKVENIDECHNPEYQYPTVQAVKDYVDEHGGGGSCITGGGAPTTATEGAVGCLYMDTGTGDMYKCTAVENGVYTWVQVDVGTVKTVNGTPPDKNGNVTVAVEDGAITYDKLSEDVKTMIADSSDQTASASAVDEDKLRLFARCFNGSGETESFVFFADPHLLQDNTLTAMQSNMQTYLGFMKNYYEATPTSFVLCAGDWIGNGDTKEQACFKLGLLDSFMRKNFHPYYPVLGNHDLNYQGVDDTGVIGTGTLTNETIRNLMFRENGNTYYSFNGQNTTFYVFESGSDWRPAMNDFRWEQIAWFANKLLEDNAAHSAIAIHIFSENTYVAATFASNVLSVAQAYNNRTTLTLNDVDYDFTSATGRVEFLLAGHTHGDNVLMVNGIQVITTTHMRDGSIPTFDLCLADYTNRKLYLERVGTGSSRRIVYLDEDRVDIETDTETETESEIYLARGFNEMGRYLYPTSYRSVYVALNDVSGSTAYLQRDGYAYDNVDWNNYYLIAIPSGKTQVTVTCPSTVKWGVHSGTAAAFQQAGGSLPHDSGWQPTGGGTYTFPDGAEAFSIVFNDNANNDMTAESYDTSEFSLTFN